MVVQTKHFGEREIDDSKIIHFENGIFGFEDIKEYTILHDGESIFYWLQAINNTSVALPLINPFVWYKDYDPEISDDNIRSIGELDAKDLSVFTVVVVPENIEDMTTNLKAPIILNTKNNLGIQVVIDSEEYIVKHNLYQHIKNMKEAGE